MGAWEKSERGREWRREYMRRRRAEHPEYDRKWLASRPGYRAWVRENIRLRARALFGNICAWCGSTSELEFAHIRETLLSNGKGRGAMRRYYDVIHNPDAYLLLCHTCHSDLDGRKG